MYIKIFEKHTIFTEHPLYVTQYEITFKCMNAKLTDTIFPLLPRPQIEIQIDPNFKIFMKRIFYQCNFFNLYVCLLVECFLKKKENRKMNINKAFDDIHHYNNRALSQFTQAFSVSNATSTAAAATSFPTCTIFYISVFKSQ